jgi:hypothetical protein
MWTMLVKIRITSSNLSSKGIGSPQLAERIEKRMVAREDGQHLAITGTTAVSRKKKRLSTL